MLLLFFSSTASAFGATEETLTASNLPPANASHLQGSSNVIGDVLYLYAPLGDGITVANITVRQVGTALDSDISLLKLIRDVNGNRVYDVGTDTIIASTTTASGVASFTGINLAISSNTTETILVAFDISGSASVGAKIQSNLIYASGDIVVVAPDKVANYGNLSGATLTIEDKPDTLTVGQSTVSPRDVIVDTGDQLMQVLEVTVNEDKAKLTALSVTRIGTATDSDTASEGVKLWYDADNNGAVSNPDWQLSTSKTFSGGRVTFDNIKLAEITTATPARLLVTYNLTANATIDRTIGASIESSASVEVAPPDLKALTAEPLAGPLHTIAPTPPTAPTGLQITAGANSRFSLSWKSNPASENVKHYSVYRSTTSDGLFSLVGTTTVTQYTDTVTVSGSYWYRLAAVNRSGESIRSAVETAKNVDLTITLGLADTTTTIESADASVKLIIPPSTRYANKTFTIRSASRPPGVKMVSRFYFELATDAVEPFDPSLTLIMKCINPVDESVAIYHFNDANKWEGVTGGTYIYDGYPDNYDVGYTNITKFSGYAAADLAFGGYNYPQQYTAKPKGPHGGYADTTNKCKECHAVHLATGSYKLTRASSHGETCAFCHGIGGTASVTVILDAEGHGLSPSEQAGMIIAPGDTHPAYTKNASSWGCLECHSVHDNKTVKLAGLSSNKLLKADPNPAKSGGYSYYTPVEGETTQTVSQWCSACHNANFGASNDGKPVLKGSVSATVFGHASSSHGMTTTPDGSPRVTLDDGKNNGPTCYDCHKADGRTGVNEFPHSSGAAPSMLKAGSNALQLDNVCVGCHRTSSLP
ncbi:MAG: hypothetical protein KGZ93_09165 [Actinobacteria bacterium]|nr:hypothetical protein [Actinomycetota bacterium]